MPGRLPWGFNPVRVAAFCGFDGGNPFRVVDICGFPPRVARSSQLWARGWNPFGIHALLSGPAFLSAGSVAAGVLAGATLNAQQFKSLTEQSSSIDSSTG
jgi:hypothetical protein